ncbi:MAG: hypothetical protein MI924_00550 [Chloroflexales bacterium]|nr:hypothetical protein [Chloroflexales bacterium]
MSDFEDYIYQTFAEAIRSWEAAEHIYALAFLILNEDDDFPQPTVRLLHNTYTQWQAASPQLPDGSDNQWPHASDSNEAKWNQPFWLHAVHASIGTSFDPLDTKGILLRRRWIEFHQLWYDDALTQTNLDREIDIGGHICTLFDELCVRVAWRLHLAIQETCGRDLPIIFFDRESLGPEAISLTKRANPQDLIREFVDYIKRWS